LILERLMSDKNDDISPEDEELENELRRLVPSKINASLIDRLALEHASLAAAPASRTHSRWMVPTLVACTVVFCGTTFWKVRSSLKSPAVVQRSKSDQRTTAPTRSRDEFVPISNEGRLVRASSGGIIESESGPRERLELDFEDVYHWHNPDTATDIRVFTPRREVIMIPVQTD